MNREEIRPDQEPQLKVLTGRLRSIICSYMELTQQIYDKISLIGYMQEPPDKEVLENPSKPNNFIEEMTMEIERLEKNAVRLEEIRNRLNELI